MGGSKSADLLPPIQVVKGCPYRCDPQKPAQACPVCQASQNASGGKASKPQTESRAVSVVDLPLGATEDRIVGALDLEKALSQGIKEFSPGLLAQAHRGFLYIDEVNLLDDHLVDLLIDVAAHCGVNGHHLDGQRHFVLPDDGCKRKRGCHGKSH